MIRLLTFPEIAATHAQPKHNEGAAMNVFNIYREERIKQGWEEFKWESLNAPQKLVWIRVAERLNKP